MRKVTLLVLFIATTARADQPAVTGVSRVLEQVLAGYGKIPDTMKVPRFAFTNSDVDQSPHDYGSLLVPTNAPSGKLKEPLAGVSADGQAGWIAGDITPTPCQRGALPDDSTGDTSYFEGQRCMWEQKGAFARAALVAERDTKGWQPVVWHLYGRSAGYVGPASYEVLQSNIAAGAQDAEKLFETSIADPKALVKTLSPRKDVMMFGSASDERFVGAARIGAALAKWNLAFKLRDGAVAGLAGKSVVWIAANLEARSFGKSKAKPSFYRALFVYEHAGDAWQLVQASFSDLEPPK